MKMLIGQRSLLFLGLFVAIFEVIPALRFFWLLVCSSAIISSFIPTGHKCLGVTMEVSVPNSREKRDTLASEAFS